MEENRIALAKTYRFDAKIQNDSVAVLSRVVDKCQRLENILLATGSKKDTKTAEATKDTFTPQTTNASNPVHSATQACQTGEELVLPQNLHSTSKDERSNNANPTRKIHPERKRTTFLNKPKKL